MTGRELFAVRGRFFRRSLIVLRIVAVLTTGLVGSLRAVNTCLADFRNNSLEFCDIIKLERNIFTGIVRTGKSPTYSFLPTFLCCKIKN